MVESIFRRAIKSSPERDVRDERALVWTMKSLIDHTELEPYVDVLHGPNGRHFLYEDHIKALINHSDIALLDRIHDLHSSCFSGILPPELAKRRKISCYRATWVIGNLAAPGASADHRLLDPSVVVTCSDEDVQHYCISATAMGSWGNLVNWQVIIQDSLTLCESAFVAGRSVDVPQPLKYLNKLQTYFDWHYDQTLLLPIITEARNGISAPFVATPFSILIEYLVASVKRKSPPPLWRSLLRELERGLEIVVYDHMDRLNADKNHHWIDDIVVTMCRYFNPRPADIEDPSVRLPWALVVYLNQR
ncbi:hypothetical protein B0H14DRAFT_3694734 [Mycena olivaceomarginata]|nr:hypothetical protein B0H14DRAFT_3694734 [Mycena olivaceomarginata]